MASEQMRVRGKAPPRPPRPELRRPIALAPIGRTWLKIDAEGKSKTVEIDRHRLTHELGIQTRDLRLLDPKFSSNYPSAILSREKALVVNLLHIKAILTMEYVLVINPDSQDRELDSFVQELENRLKDQNFRPSASFPVLSNLIEQKKGAKSKEGGKEKTKEKKNQAEEGAKNDDSDTSQTKPPSNDTSVFPFELKALEVCLESICRTMDSHATQLEGMAFPAVDDLTMTVNTKNLQRVRAVKSKIVQQKTQVETVKEILEKLLDDDEDMHDMNLTAKQQHRSSSVISNAALPLAPFPSLLQSSEPFGSMILDDNAMLQHETSSSSSSSTVIDEAVQEVEMLLEAYFLQMDTIFNRLSTLSEYIDDTEAFINIVQDKHRNQLLQLELFIGAGTFALTIVAVIAGIFGMNLDSSIPPESNWPFKLVTGFSLVIALLVLLFILWFCRKKGLMAI